MNKLNISVYNDWLEATWTKEVTIVNDVEKDGKWVQQESVITEQVWCESFSGHREHIQMLINKASEFATSLDEYKDLIKQCEDSFIYPMPEELAAINIANKKQEALSYLASTDWYVTRKSETGVDIPAEISTKRAEARLLI